LEVGLASKILSVLDFFALAWIPFTRLLTSIERILLMNKAELTKEISQHPDISMNLKESSLFLDTLLQVIQRTLVAGGEVRFPGLGVFKPITRAARKGINPRTGEALQIPSRVVVKFSASSELKELANNS